MSLSAHAVFAGKSLGPAAFLLAALVWLAAACSQSSSRSDSPAPGAGATGGVTGGAGAASGGSGGASASSGGAAAEGAGGAASGTGGASEASGGAPGDAAPDAPQSLPTGDAGPLGDVGAGDVPLVLDDPATWPGGAYGKAFIIACPDGASRTACCAHYCGCMSKICGNVGSVKLPKDCMGACLAPDAVSGWDLRCRVYNCFESLNPLAQKDRVAHCEHAGARGAGDTYEKCHKAGEPSEK